MTDYCHISGPNHVLYTENHLARGASALLLGIPNLDDHARDAPFRWVLPCPSKESSAVVHGKWGGECTGLQAVRYSHHCLAARETCRGFFLNILAAFQPMRRPAHSAQHSSAGIALLQILTLA
jgi:hypothetical protein